MPSLFGGFKDVCKGTWGLVKKGGGLICRKHKTMGKVVEIVTDAWEDSEDSNFDVSTYSISERNYARDQGKKVKNCKSYKNFIFKEPLDKIKEKVRFIIHDNPKNGKGGEKTDPDKFSRAAEEAVQIINDNLVLDGFHWCTELLKSVITYCAQRCPQSLLDALEDALFCDMD